MKVILLLFVMFTSALSSFGQTGFLNLNVFNTEGDSIGFEPFTVIEFLDLDSTVLIKLQTDFEPFDQTPEFSPGNYLVKISNMNSMTRVSEFSYSITHIEITPFSILSNDTNSLELHQKRDTINRDTVFYIDLLDLKGEFYCYWQDCIDSNNLKTGIEQGYYCQIIGKAGDHYSVYVRSKHLLKIKTENNTETYCYDPTNSNIIKTHMKPYAMKRNEIFEFIKENFKNGELKKELTLDGKTLSK